MCDMWLEVRSCLLKGKKNKKTKTKNEKENEKSLKFFKESTFNY